MCEGDKLKWYSIDERWSCIWIKRNLFWSSSMGYQNDLQKYILLIKRNFMHEHRCLKQIIKESSIRGNNTELWLSKIIDYY
jgi:hypothetical protein